MVVNIADTVDVDGGCNDVSAEPEVVSLQSGDVTAAVDSLIVGAPVSRPELVMTCSLDVVIASCVSVMRDDVTYDVMYNVANGEPVSAVSWKPG